MTTEFLKLDVWNTKNVIIKVNQGEINARFLEVQFMDKNEPLDLENRRVFFFAKKPDGNLIFNRCEIIDEKNGTVNLALTSQMSIVDGIIRDCEFDIISLDLARLKVKGLILKIEKCTDFDSATESTSEFTALEEAIVWCEKAKAIIDEHIEDKNNPHGVTTEQIGAAETIHTHSADDITSGALPIARGGTGADDIYTAHNNLGLMKRYKNFDHLTLSDNCTITDILTAMTSNTYIETAVSTVSKYHNLFPGTQGFARLVKVNADRSFAEFINMSGNSTVAGIWVGYHRPNSTFTGWKRIYTSFDTIPITNGGTGSTSASTALSNLGGVPKTRTINSKALSNDIALTATDVNAVPTTRTINNKQLSEDIVLNYSDIQNAPTKLSEFTNDAGYISGALPELWYVLSSGITKGLSSICYGNSLYVVVGVGGIIYTSTDGFTWTFRTSNVSVVLRSVIYSGDKYVAAGDSGTILTSEDGITWTVQTSNVTVTLNSISYANSKYVVVGSSGTVLTSDDAINWSSTTVGTKNLRCICYDNGMFVMVGNSGVIYTSSDATTWTYRYSNTTKNLLAVCYGNGKFVISGAGGVTTYSTDGINWAQIQTVSVSDLDSICYGEEFKVGGHGAYMFSSQDGVNWQEETNPSKSPDVFRSILYNDSKYYAVGDTISKTILVKLNKLSDVLKFISSKM